MLGRRKIAMLMAEFLGTGTLTAVVLAVSRSSIGIPYFVALAVGLTIAAVTLTFGAVSGAHLNPAMTIGMWTVRKVSSTKAVTYLAAQLLGAWLAYVLYTYLVNAHWANTGHFTGRVLAAETAGAFVFSLAWAAVVFQKFENSKAASVLGGSLAIGVLVASSASAGLLNPAVALGVRSWGWGTYVLGPILGAVLGFNLYNMLFAPSETAVATSNKSGKKKK